MVSALMPVIKVCGSPNTCRVMAENIDIDSPDVMYGETTVEEMGKRLFDEIVDVAKGTLTRAEQLGHMELHLH